MKQFSYTISLLLLVCASTGCVNVRTLNLESVNVDKVRHRRAPQATAPKQETHIDITLCTADAAGCVLTKTKDRREAKELGRYSGSFVALRDTDKVKDVKAMARANGGKWALYMPDFSRTLSRLLDDSLSKRFTSVDVVVDRTGGLGLAGGDQSSITFYGGHVNAHHWKRTQVTLCAIPMDGNPLTADGGGEYHLSHWYKLSLPLVIVTIPSSLVVLAVVTPPINDKMFCNSIVAGLDDASAQLADKMAAYSALHMSKGGRMKWRVMAMLEEPAVLASAK